MNCIIVKRGPGAFPAKIESPETLSLLVITQFRARNRFPLSLELLSLFVVSQFRARNRFPLSLELLQAPLRAGVRS